jgi:hypothetical protein
MSCPGTNTFVTAQGGRNSMFRLEAQAIRMRVLSFIFEARERSLRATKPEAWQMSGKDRSVAGKVLLRKTRDHTT